MYLDVKFPDLIILNEEAGHNYDICVHNVDHLQYEIGKLLLVPWASKETILAVKVLYLEVLHERCS